MDKSSMPFPNRIFFAFDMVLNPYINNDDDKTLKVEESIMPHAGK